MRFLAPLRIVGRAFVLALLASLLVASAGRAEAPIRVLFAAPVAAGAPCHPMLEPSYISARAGTFTDFCAAYYVTSGAPSGDDPRQVTFDTPVGFTATSQVSPQCKLETFAPSSTTDAPCPENTRIGEGQAWVRVDVGGVVIAQTAHVSVYNLDYTDKEWGRVGLQMEPELAGIKFPRTKLVARITLRPYPDVGLRTVIDDLPRMGDLGLGKVPIATDGFALRFYGSKTDHPGLARSFGYLGTDCSTPQTTVATSVAYDGTVSSKSYQYPLTDCASLTTGVTASMDLSDRRPDVTTQAALAIRPAFDPGERSASYLRKATVVMPPGIAIAGQVASAGLPVCTAAQFARTQQRSATCPAATSVGKVEFTSPNLNGVFSGDVFLGEQREPGGLPDILIQVEQSGDEFAARAKLVGTMRWDEQNRLVTEFDGLPQLPFGEFKLTLRGGDHGILTTPRACGTYSGEVTLTPSNGTADVRTPLPIAIDQDCVDPDAFRPTMSVTTSTSQAGARGGVTTITVARPDRQARIARVDADLPPGLLADLRGVAECAPEQLSAASCPASSRIGSVSAAVGVGPAPLISPGDVFLMAPPAGAAAGVGIQAPVRFGDLDLGVLTMTGRIDLRQSDFGLRFSADVPNRYLGFPLELQRFVVALDRPDFGRNPTTCEPLVATGRLQPDRGAIAEVRAPLQFTGCGALGFSPTLTTSLSGDLWTKGRPGVAVRLEMPNGDGSIRSAKVTMPSGLATDLEVPKRACAEQTWIAGTCPRAAVVGQAVAYVSVLPEPLRGAVSLVKVPGNVLPGVGVQFFGRYASRIVGRLGVAKTGQLVADFSSIPDVPLTRMDLTFVDGPTGALQVTDALCETGRYGFEAQFGGQSGAIASRSTAATCPLSARMLVRSRLASALRLRLTPPTGRAVRRVAVTLPASMAVRASAAGKGGRVRGVRCLCQVVRQTPRTLTVVPAASVTGGLTISIPRRALMLSGAARAAASVTLRVTVSLSDGTSREMTVAVALE